MEELSGGIDRRVRRSRRALREAFVALVVEQGYSSITIEALTARADTSKATFYAHFHDMEDLLGAVVGDLVADLVTEAESAVTTGKEQPIAQGSALVTICWHVDANRDLYRVALSGAGNGQARAALTAALTAATERVFVRVVDEMGASPRRQPALVARSWVGACLTLIDHWLQADHDLSAAEFSSLIAPLLLEGPLWGLGLDDSVAVVSQLDIVDPEE
jgi:AcrR family transcriptional regulator